MNIVRALDAALPELPERVLRRDTPRLDSRIITKEHIENGQRVVIAKVPGSDMVLRFTPEQWKLIQLFNGQRTYGEIAGLSVEHTGFLFDEDGVREIASFLFDNTEFLYKTPLQKNIVLKQELRGQRRKRRQRFHIPDFTDIIVKEWPNADQYISRLYPSLRFIYRPWFVLLSLISFSVMLWMWADKFGEIWNDSFEFYNFTAKSGTDLLEFWLLFAAMAFFHETAHGLTCKHFGGNVEKMGFTLMYFAPSFFCDASQVWIYGGKWERIATAIAGIWIDLILCVMATVVWWGTATGMVVHEVAYKVMMVTGIGVSLLNLNPLIKLDGYLIFCELIHEPDLKEKSTAYFSGIIRRDIFRLPSDVEFVPRRRRAFYAIYAILSGMYGYLLLSFLMVFTFHILEAYTPEWAFLPALGIGYWVFKSRIKMLVRFMKTVYLDKRERVRASLTAPRITAISAAALLILFLPIWPDFVVGRFLMEPAHKAEVRTEIGGHVTTVFVREGQSVTAGQPLVQLTNLPLESVASQASADLRTASAQAENAIVHYGDIAATQASRREMAEHAQTLSEEVAHLRVTSPIAGVIATPRIEDRVGAYLERGDEIAEVADLSTMNARIYIPEFAIKDIRAGTRVRLQSGSQVIPVSATLTFVAPASTTLETGLVPKDQLKGITPPRFYVGSALLANRGDLREGMTGTAKIFVARRSIAGFTWRFVRDLVDRRVW
jgi:putative peptide zinc metalloprotease protein